MRATLRAAFADRRRARPTEATNSFRSRVVWLDCMVLIRGSSLLALRVGIANPGRIHLGREFVECLAPGLIPISFVVEQILESHTPVGSDLVERKFAGFEEVHQVLSRDPKVVGSGLGGERLILRDEHDGLPFGHQTDDAGEVGEERLRNMGPASLTIDECDVIRFGEGLGQFGKFVLAKERRVETIGAGAEHDGNRVRQSGDSRKTPIATTTTDAANANVPPLYQDAVKPIQPTG